MWDVGSSVLLFVTVAAGADQAFFTALSVIALCACKEIIADVGEGPAPTFITVMISSFYILNCSLDVRP